jgi:hypothetical protein
LRTMGGERGLTNTLFFDEIDPEEIPGLLAQCHIGILALDPRHKTHNIPGKFLTYVQAGLPVLARINPNNDLVELIEKERLGCVDVELSIDSLQKLAESMVDGARDGEPVADRGRAVARQLFSPATAVSQIVRAISNG